MALSSPLFHLIFAMSKCSSSSPPHTPFTCCSLPAPQHWLCVGSDTSSQLKPQRRPCHARPQSTLRRALSYPTPIGGSVLHNATPDQNQHYFSKSQAMYRAQQQATLHRSLQEHCQASSTVALLELDQMGHLCWKRTQQCLKFSGIV
jgi:hypothetical protein